MINHEKYLVTLDEFFYGPDGDYYYSVYGRVEIIKAEDLLGFKPNINSTNWYLKIYGDTEFIMIDGNKVHYALKTDITPKQYSEVKTPKDTVSNPNTVTLDTDAENVNQNDIFIDTVDTIDKNTEVIKYKIYILK